MLKTMIVHIHRSSPAYIPLLELTETFNTACVCMSHNNDGISFVVDIMQAAKSLAAMSDYKKWMPASDPLDRFDLWEEEMLTILRDQMSIFISRFTSQAVNKTVLSESKIIFLAPKVEVVSSFDFGPGRGYAMIPEFFGTTGTQALNPSDDVDKLVFKTNVHIRNAFVNILNYFEGDRWVCNSEGSWTPWKE